MTMFNRLFTQITADNCVSVLDKEEAMELVQQYESFLRDFAPLPDCVDDISKFPFNKEKIKAAILLCLGQLNRPEDTERLRHDYLMMASWQEGVGEETIGLDFTRIDLTRDPLEVSEIIQVQGAKIERWKPLIAAERTALMRELKANGA